MYRYLRLKIDVLSTTFCLKLFVHFIISIQRLFIFSLIYIYLLYFTHLTTPSGHYYKQEFTF